MNSSGISADEACSMRVLADEDFARMCNPDGSTKHHEERTEVSIQGTDISYTVTPSQLYIGAGITMLTIVIVVALLVYKKRVKRGASK